MEKELTRIDIIKTADKVLSLIKSEVDDNQDFIKIVLYECESQIQIEEDLERAKSL